MLQVVHLVNSGVSIPVARCRTLRQDESGQTPSVKRSLCDNFAQKQQVRGLAQGWGQLLDNSRALLKKALKGTRASVAKPLKQKKARTPLQRRASDGKRRRMAVLEAKCNRLSDGNVNMCFGSEKLFRAHYDLSDSRP